MSRYNIVVKGKVQGVGFRYFVQSIANTMKLSGWVKNLDNGDVQLQVQQEYFFLEELLNKLKKGNGFSKVEKIEYTELNEIIAEKSFKITY